MGLISILTGGKNKKSFLNNELSTMGPGEIPDGE